MKPKNKAMVISLNGVIVVHEGEYQSDLVIIEPSDIGGAYKPEKVISIKHEYHVKRLRDFLNELCTIYDKHEEYQQKLNEIEKGCTKCDKYNVDFWPSKEICPNCDIVELAEEAFDRYR